MRFNLASLRVEIIPKIRNGIRVVKFIKIVNKSETILIFEKDVPFLDAAVINMIDWSFNELWFFHNPSEES